ncbi:hypothetical protein F5883DRAFT_700531 [Diaporthe sp. PMI_573]|nr:hypothetical protein F5883DRAFT_700531 [Diaporthaceae sp. PMI_573]
MSSQKAQELERQIEVSRAVRRKKVQLDPNELFADIEAIRRTQIEAGVVPEDSDGLRVRNTIRNGVNYRGGGGVGVTAKAAWVTEGGRERGWAEIRAGHRWSTMWRVDHHHMKAREYRREYFKNYPPDEPQEEADDRNRLYAVKEEIMYSAHVPGTKARAQALDDLKFLIKKYVEYEDSDEEDEEDEDSDVVSSGDEKQLLVPYSL